MLGGERATGRKEGGRYKKYFCKNDALTKCWR